MKTALQNKETLIKEIEGLPFEKIKEVLDFVYFIKVKDIIDPTEFYFWTKQWQTLESEADKDKEAGNIIGDGSLENLLKELKI